MAEKPAVVAAPAVKVSKKKPVKATRPSGPPLSERIINIVNASNDRHGVSRPAIKKQLSDGGCDVEGNRARICTAIRSLQTKGKLVAVKASFKAAPATKTKKVEAARKPAAKKPAAKKPVAKKPAAKKPADKKAAAKKKVAKKPLAKAVKKPAAKKPAAKAVKKPAAGNTKKKAVKITKKSPAKKVSAKTASKPKPAKKAASKKK